MGGLLEFFATGVGASILGAFGAVVTRSFDFVNKREQNKHEITMRTMDYRELELEIKGKTAVADKIAESEIAKAQLNTMGIARSANSSKLGVAWADVFNGTLPAFITVYFLLLTTALAIKLYSPEYLANSNLFVEIISNIIFLTVAYCCFWIGVNPTIKRR